MDMPIRCALLFFACCVIIPVVYAQPTPCSSELEIPYEGPCYYGTLPTFFDDFAYESARTTGDVADAPEGDLFGTNTWYVREGNEQTRAWYRFNRSDLPIPGAITFREPSTLVMRLPEGLASSGHFRTPAISTAFTAEAGTYAARVRFSELWPGQRLRQAFWTYSNSSFIFDRITATDTVRARYWSELDFENQNHFQGTRRDGVFVPDYVTRMSVGNHFGELRTPRGSRRLGPEGPVPGERGRGKLARNGPAHNEADADAPLIPSWADEWLYLIIYVDEETRTVTYRMLPERPRGALRALEEVNYTAGPDFYPLWPTHPAFSIRWTERQGSLRRPLYLETDWFFYSPVAKLSVEDVREQVEHLRQNDLARVNTTGRATFQSFAPDQPILPTVRGPQRVMCGEEATWTLDVYRLGRYYVTYRYRVLHSDGAHELWQDVHSPTLTLTPQSSQLGVEIMVTTQDLWTPHGVVEGVAGWNYPHPENDKEQTHFTAQFDCDAR
jgi:hypothetical protein